VLLSVVVKSIHEFISIEKETLMLVGVPSVAEKLRLKFHLMEPNPGFSVLTDFIFGHQPN